MSNFVLASIWEYSYGLRAHQEMHIVICTIEKETPVTTFTLPTTRKCAQTKMDSRTKSNYNCSGDIQLSSKRLYISYMMQIFSFAMETVELAI